MRLQQTLQRFRNQFKTKRPNQPAKKKSRRLQLEHLEDRTLLSTILWTNKGNSGSDTDGFNAVFGSNADIARSDVQAAIDEWAQAIVNFNYSNGSNTFSLNISMGGPGNGASAGGPSVLNGKPISGNISMGSGGDGHGSGWYLDPTPNTSEEFRGTIVNNYAMNATPGGPADGLGDFETVALAEVTHEMGQFPCCGLNWQTTSFLNNSGQADACCTGTLYTFNGPDVQGLYTTDNSGGEFGAPVHTAEPNAANVVTSGGITYYGSQNNGNAFYEFSRRYVLSNLTVLALGDVYGYTVAVPTQNAYINYDPNTGNLLVRGGSHGENIYPSQANPSNDTITIDSFSFFGFTFVTASVSIGNPTPGTGPNITYSNSFFAPAVTSITVDGNDGSGIINVNSTISGIPVTINESSGNTTVNITPSTEFMDNIQGNVFVNSGSGVDTLNFFDQNNSRSDTWTITGSTVTRSSAATIFYNGQNFVNITGGSGNLTYNVLSTEFGFTTSIDTGPGTDTVNVQSTAFFSTLNINNLFSTSNQDTVTIGSLAPSLGGTLANIAGTVNVANSSGGGTTLTLDDSGDTTGQTFTETSGSITGTAFFGTVNYNGGEVKFLNLLGGSGGNTFNVQSTASGTTTSINTDDTLTANTNNHVNIGSLAPSLGGTMANIAGPVNVSSLSGSTTLTLDDSGDTTGQSFTVTNNSITGTEFTGTINYSQVSTLTIDGGSGIDTFNVQSTAFGTTTNLVLQSLSTVHVGSIAPSLGGTLAGIAGPLNISNASVVTVDDSGDGAAQTATITNGSISGTWSPAVISYTGASTLSVHAGGGGDTINVQSTSATTNLILAGSTTVNVGNAGSVQGILGTLNIENPPSFNTIVVDDSADPTARTVTLSTLGANFSDSEGNSDSWGQIVGLAPAHINYEYADTSSLTVNGGTGGNTFNVQATSLALGGTTTLNTGAGNDTVNVLATSTPLSINGQAGSNTVNLSDGVQANGLDNLTGAVTVNGAGGTTLVNLNDQSATFSDTYTITNSTVSRIIFGGLTYSNIAGLTLNAETGNNTINIMSTASGTPVTINDNAGSDTVNLSDGVQANGLDNLPGHVTVNGSGGTTVVNLNDQSAGFSDTYTITSSTVSRIIFGGLTYSNIAGLTLNAETGNNTINVNSTASGTPLTINDDAGADTVNLGSGNLDTLAGAVTVNGAGGSTTVNVNDSTKTGVQTYVVTSSTVTRGPSFAGLTYGSIQSLVLTGGTGADIYNIRSTAAGTTTTVNGGIGNDTFNVGDLANTLNGIQGALTVHGNGGTNTLNVHDQGTPSDTFTLSSTVLSRVLPSPVSITYGTIKTLNISAGGNDTLTVLSPVPTTTTNFNAGGGTNTLIGANVSNTWTITGANKGTLGKVAFTNVQNLVGGTGNDTFKFSGASPSISGTIVGGGGTNKLDYSLNGGVAVTVNLQTHSAPDINGGAPGGFSNIQSLVGSTAATDILIAANTFNNWSITGPNAGKVNTFSFTGIEHLVGGTGVDVFKISPAGTELSIDGGAAPLHQGNWLDYTPFTTLQPPVVVNLATNAATNINGGAAGAIANIQDVHGGNGGNTLTGNSQGNILVGGSGVDNILGGSGRSLLIGDLGADNVTGGSGATASGGDILIGGTTIWDSDTNAHLISLMAVLAEWQNTAHTYAQRVSFLRLGGGLNGSNKLIFGTTVHDDSAANVLTAATAGPGTPAVDWFFTGALDTAVNTESGEAHNNGFFP